MSRQRLVHDTAMASGQACLDVIASCIYESYHKDVRDEFYQIIKAGIEAFLVYDEREKQRLKPGVN